MRKRLKKIGKLILLLSILFTGCSSDLHTKKIAKEELRQNTIEVIDNYIDLTYVENHASAFGIFKQIDRSVRLPLILFIQGTIILLGLLVLWKIRNKNIGLLIAITVLLSGAFGNFMDRLLNGYVTDFLYLHYFDKYSFPVFNLADILINTGVILLILQAKQFKKAIQSVFNSKMVIDN